jgi:hypothetical protein
MFAVVSNAIGVYQDLCCGPGEVANFPQRDFGGASAGTRASQALDGQVDFGYVPFGCMLDIVQMKRHEAWRLEYRRNRYMRDLSIEDVLARAGDLIDESRCARTRLKNFDETR